MFDPTEYRNACGGLRLSREKLEEIMKTTEQNRQKKRRASVRTALVAAALCAALAVSAGAAYPNALEAILAGIRSRTPVGDYREELVLDSGERVTALREVGAYVEERDGRMITGNGPGAAPAHPRRARPRPPFFPAGFVRRAPPRHRQ